MKVWDKRLFRDLDDDVDLGTRNIKMALRRLRKFARQGADTELDLPDTIRATANNAGGLEIKMVPQRRNAVKVLLLLDIGGSMDDHVRLCSELFTASKSEFKHLETFYFHNCVYERVWKSNRRRSETSITTLELLRTYNSDYRLIFVGDASMSPYELIQPGGSVEHWNDEAGRVWVERLTRHFTRAAWLNPLAEQDWRHTQSIGIIRQLMADRMFPLTLDGLDNMVRSVRR